MKRAWVALIVRDAGMLLRVVAAALIAGPLGLAGPARAREPVAAKPSPPATLAPSSKQASPANDKDATPAKQRQIACAAEWRGLSASEKTAQGPKWPQFYSRCVKRLKAQKD